MMMSCELSDVPCCVIEAHGEQTADHRLLHLAHVFAADHACAQRLCDPRASASNSRLKRSVRPIALIGLMPIIASVKLAASCRICARWRRAAFGSA